MNHGLKAHVDFAATDDLGDIGRVIGLKDGNLDALLFEVALGLSDV